MMPAFETAGLRGDWDKANKITDAVLKRKWYQESRKGSKAYVRVLFGWGWRCLGQGQHDYEDAIPNDGWRCAALATC